MIRVAINGFGRIGRLALRAAWDWPDIEIVHINEIDGSADEAAHLLTYDSVQGKWDTPVVAVYDELEIDGRRVGYSQHSKIDSLDWQSLNVDVVVECTGVHRQLSQLKAYIDLGVDRVVVSAPVKEGVPNIVYGVNQHIYDGQRFVSAASCTTNCIAPVIKVLHEQLKILRGSFTTIHNVTNTQSVLDQYHKDPRRARMSSASLIPTTTGSASAIGDVFPELNGALTGIAVRVPLANASLTDCVFEVATPTDAAAVNSLLQTAADNNLVGILGVEMQPLVSVDYCGDTRSAIVDGLSTSVVQGSHVKVLV